MAPRTILCETVGKNVQLDQVNGTELKPGTSVFCRGRTTPLRYDPLCRGCAGGKVATIDPKKTTIRKSAW